MDVLELVFTAQKASDTGKDQIVFDGCARTDFDALKSINLRLFLTGLRESVDMTVDAVWNDEMDLLPNTKAFMIKTLILKYKPVQFLTENSG